METEKVKLTFQNNQWHMQYKGTYGPGNYPKIEVDEDDGPHFITFTITGNTNATFSNDPIWVSDSAKPKQAKLDHDQIVSWKVKQNGKKLIVFDWNDRPGEIHYQLNFSDGTVLDPVIQNGGGTGGEPIIDDVAAGAILLAALVAFTLGMWVYRLLDRRAGASVDRSKPNAVG